MFFECTLFKAQANHFFGNLQSGRSFVEWKLVISMKVGVKLQRKGSRKFQKENLPVEEKFATIGRSNLRAPSFRTLLAELTRRPAIGRMRTN